MNVPTILMWMCIAGLATWVVLCLANLSDKFCGAFPHFGKWDRLKRRMKRLPEGSQVHCKHGLWVATCPVCKLQREVECKRLELEKAKLEKELDEVLPLATEVVEAEELP